MHHWSDAASERSPSDQELESQWSTEDRASVRNVQKNLLHTHPHPDIPESYLWWDPQYLSLSVGFILFSVPLAALFFNSLCAPLYFFLLLSHWIKTKLQSKLHLHLYYNDGDIL